MERVYDDEAGVEAQCQNMEDGWPLPPYLSEQQKPERFMGSRNRVSDTARGGHGETAPTSEESSLVGHLLWRSLPGGVRSPAPSTFRYQG